MKLLLLLLLPIILLAEEAATEPTPYVYIIKSYEIIDGDTLRCDIDLGFDLTIKIDVRIDGIDTPEVNRITQRPAGNVATEFARYWLTEATKNGRKIYCHSIERDKYAGRIVGRVLNDQGAKLGQFLIASKVAHVYDGSGPRPEWTEEELDEISKMTIPTSNEVKTADETTD